MQISDSGYNATRLTAGGYRIHQITVQSAIRNHGCQNSIGYLRGDAFTFSLQQTSKLNV